MPKSARPTSKSDSKPAKSESARPSKKAKPSVTGSEFQKEAKDLYISLANEEGGEVFNGFLAKVTEFGTGSVGWKGSSIASLPVGEDGEKTVEVNVSINIVVKGSKPKGEGASNGKKRKSIAKDEDEDDQEE